MKSTANKVIITYYDGTGKHESSPADSITLVCVNYSVPTTKDPTFTYALHTEEETQYITVPFTHSIEPEKAFDNGN